MQALSFSHDFALVAMSCVVSLAAGFTGLSLTRNLSAKTLAQRKYAVALASIALGGGIWSMHFVAMLGLQLPILFYYDVAITLASALTAILIVGGALILLHFTERTPRIILAAGAVVGAGVLAMHYIGMAGLQLCRAVYTPTGVVFSSVVAVALCMLAFWVAYGRRTNRNLVLGTLCFAAAVCSVHFLAMAGTNFVEVPQLAEFGPSMSNKALALWVLLSSFVIFGACLLVSTAYLTPVSDAPAETAPSSPEVQATEIETATAPDARLQIPCEREGGKVFVAPREVALVRADGHYTQVYTDKERFFCAWPITESAKRLLPMGFLKSHRSYLINPGKVARFERTKDKGSCTFTSTQVPAAPVSRSNLTIVEESLTA